jgi:hypothetical protein
MDGGSSSKIGSKVAAAGGFFSTDDALKTKDQLRASVEKTSSDTPAVSTNVMAQALSKVEGRFRKEIEIAANDLNRRESQVKQAKNDLKGEKEALIKLKDAFDSDDSEQIEKAQSELEDLRIIRVERLTQVQAEQRIGGVGRNVTFGNSQEGRIELPEIDISKVAGTVPQNKKEANQQLDVVKQDMQAVRDLKEPLKQAREALAQIFSGGQKKLGAIQETSVKSLAQAEDLATDISDQVSDYTEEQLISSVFANVNTTLLAQKIL